MSWSNPTAPNLPDFILFVQDAMQINTLLLPANSPFLTYAFNQALAICIAIPSVPPYCVPAASGIEYTLAVYNLGGHILIRITPDQTGRTFFADQRAAYNLLQLTAGVVMSASDNGTSETLAVPDAIKQLTIGDLQYMKTPWGREYLAYAQDFGGIWGLS